MKNEQFKTSRISKAEIMALVAGICVSAELDFESVKSVILEGQK